MRAFFIFSGLEKKGEMICSGMNCIQLVPIHDGLDCGNLKHWILDLLDL